MNIHDALKAVGLYHPIRHALHDWRLVRRGRLEEAQWKAEGRPAPPPAAVKHRTIRHSAREWRTPILVETGTWTEDSVFCLRRDFTEIHTIELARELHRAAVERFARFPHIHCHFGDSGVLLPEIAVHCTRPTLYWLDGHFCGGPSARAGSDTPIRHELDFLLARAPRRDVILIDDARLFDGTDGYHGLAELEELVRRARPSASFRVEEDIIRIAPC